jgi:hypothetical protein
VPLRELRHCAVLQVRVPLDPGVMGDGHAGLGNDVTAHVSSARN